MSYSRIFKITERLSPQESNVLSLAKLHISDFSINKKIPSIKILKSRGSRIDFWEMRGREGGAGVAEDRRRSKFACRRL